MRVLIIGLDGFTWTIGNKLIHEGYMPRLGALVQKGCHGDLNSVTPYETSPAWSSFQTGCLPGKTGIFAFHSYHHEQRLIRLNSFQQISKASIWELLSDAGKKVISINMPMTSPPPKVNGIIIPGLTCPELSRETVYPPEIFDTHIQPNPDYRIVDNTKKPDLKSYVESAMTTEQCRCDVALKLMQEQPWDLFSVEMQSTDAFQHKNWWSLDPQAEGFTQEAYLQSVRFYQQIDEIIGRLVDGAGESVLTVIVSDHGFCAKKAEIGINTWLYQNGYLQLNMPVDDNNADKSFKEQLKQRVPLIKSLAGWYGQLKQQFVASRENHQKKGQLYSEKVVSHIREIIDMDRTVAFCLGGMGGSLYITKKDQKAQVDELIQKLLDTFGPHSSNPLIENVRSMEEICGKDTVSDAYPDYLISLAPGVEARISPLEQEIIKSGSIGGRQTGTHAPNGIFVMSGKNVKAGTTLNAEIIDIAPTVLACLSTAIPDYTDGSVLNSAFVEPPAAAYQVVSKDDRGDADYSDIDQSVVEKQLKDLGYL